MSRTGMICHFFNESDLLVYFIDHHLAMFDEVIAINHQSTDNSVEIIKRYAPNWRIVDSKLSNFRAIENDREVEYYEQQLTTDWKITLNITEFLFIPNLKETLLNLNTSMPLIEAFGIRTASIVDKDNLPLLKPLWKNRTNGFLNYSSNNPTIRRWRYIHRSAYGHYETGRHGTKLLHMELPALLMLHFRFSPWPQCISRALQIQTRIPPQDKNQGLGFEHIITKEEFENKHKEHLIYSNDLLLDKTYKDCYDRLLGEYDETARII